MSVRVIADRTDIVSAGSEEGGTAVSVRTMTDTEDAIEKYSGLVYGLALAHTSSKSDADDAFQETFLAYHRCMKKWNGEEHRKAWLIRTAINMSRRIMLSPWRRKTVSLDEAGESGVPFRYETSEQNEIAAAVRDLPDKYRSVIWLYYFEDMTTEEISAALGIRVSTVRSQLTRGRDMLRSTLRKEVDHL